MELIKKSYLYHNYLLFKNIYSKNGRFYKYSDNCDIVKRINQNKDKLTEELYSLPLEMFYYNGDTFGFSTEYLNEYLNINSVNNRYITYDKWQFINNVILIMRELENIGLIYYDIHGGNFMINAYNDFKVVDLDGVKIKTDKIKIKMLSNFMNFLLSIYFFSNLEYSFYSLEDVLNRKVLDEYLSREVKEYCEYLLNSPQDIIDYDITIIAGDIDKSFKERKLVN